MRNELFQMAKAAVHEAEASTDSGEKAKAVARAKNALSSAYANSTDAERRQLHDLQEQLDQRS
ncbi:DUF3813 domain-containing protein [Bacillus paralicheniformis]|jgi:hypothetical protein|uniref:DUF3813 domain-containing protein n=1 Tax=Bacillus paralicheniformis TaxID=1648923 RepID=A0A6I7TNF6_9BACI|nr:MULTISPECIES: DUF3813 domain-containing protein [Bacillus]ETB70899.1 hypothetical protein A943_12650 [Bacillus sp. CPSM8]KUL09694.1 hypothetical protein LI7559_12090 [Bacillus licheniformis LMG 7559]KUL17288.1 hypothetical protein LI6934_10920 [Bacillus licheniformis LMG 6934]MBC8623842.1 DUF3813 domain-containing protein [Robertmurraya crescens]POO83377.1 DUF3813 domain-containing protein [Bacillus sp. MBGLi97]